MSTILLRVFSRGISLAATFLQIFFCVKKQAISQHYISYFSHNNKLVPEQVVTKFTDAYMSHPVSWSKIVKRKCLIDQGDVVGICHFLEENQTSRGEEFIENIRWMS